MKLDRPKYIDYEPGDFDAPMAAGFNVVELKFDGWWGQLLIEHGEWKLYSRTGQLKKNGKVGVHGLGHTLLHGEFVYGTEWAGDHPAFYDKVAVFDAEMVDGVDVRGLPNAERRNVVSVFLSVLEKEPIEKGLFLVTQSPIAHAKALWDSHGDFEGVVFKDSTRPWGAQFGRMKREVTMDYICLGFEQSDSDRHAEWGVASVLGGLYGSDGKVYEVCKVSGLNDRQRRIFHDAPNDFVGKVFEASGKKLSKTGALRHPNFLRWRDDKASADCRWPPESK